MTEGIDATEGDSGVTQVEAIAVVLVDLPPVLEELRLEWADRHQALVGAVLVDLRAVLAVEASVVLPADLAVVSEALQVALSVGTAKAGLAR